MAQFDLSLDQLATYEATITEPADFDDFWATTLTQTRAQPLDATFTEIDTGLVAVDTYDVEYSGFGGHRIKAWLQLPARALHDGQPLPGVVQYQGYSGGRGLPQQNVMWALAGYAYLVMDTRGQGSGGSVGDTADPVGSAPSHSGFMTRGIGDPENYYYRRVFSDAVRAVEVLRGHEAVDERRVAVTGTSQGGGITLAVAALVPDVLAAMPDVPFLCDFRRATTLIDTDPYGEIVRYLKAHRDEVDRVFTTLSYFDGAVMARRATAPSLFSVALMDEICPPSTVFAAYNAYKGPKQIEVYQFNDHEGGQFFQVAAQLQWLRRLV